MNMNQFTQKSLEAIQGAQSLAVQHGNQQIEQPHLLLALADQEGGFIPQLLTHMGLTLESFRAAARHEVEILPKVSGAGREADKVYIAPGVDKALSQALAIAGGMKDEFVSVEHILLALIDTAEGRLKELLRTYNVDKEKVMQALAALRGNQRVTSDNPEETYEALKKYGSDLVERARQNKLDPVIGRAEEIERVVQILNRRQKNNPAASPRLPQIQKEAFRWKRLGVDTLERAEDYLRRQEAVDGREWAILQAVGVTERRPAVEKEREYIAAWVDMGVSDELIRMAYERTVYQKKAMNWPYMNKILLSWHQAGYKTPQQVEEGDKPPRRQAAPAKAQPRDFQPSQERVRKNNEWLKQFLEEQKKGEG